MRRTFRSCRPPRGPGRTSLAACTEPAETDTAKTFYAQLAVSLPQSHGLHGDTVSGHEGSMAEFVNAYDCGHRTTVTRYGAAGLAWCWVCQRFVGVIVQAVNPPPAVSAVTQHGPQQ